MLSAIQARYGSKQALLRHISYGLLSAIGRYRHLSHPCFAKVDRLVYVCSGNICRSAFGSQAARSAPFEAVSFGLHCPDGDPAHDKMQRVAHAHELDLSSHQSSNIANYTPRPGDLVLGMEPSHAQQMPEAIYGAAQVSLLGLWSRHRSVYLHDPYSAGPAYFEHCAQRITEATHTLIKRIRDAKAG